MVTHVTVIKRVNIESYHRMVNNINVGVCVNFSLNDSFTLKESTKPCWHHIYQIWMQSDVN